MTTISISDAELVQAAEDEHYEVETFAEIGEAQITTLTGETYVVDESRVYTVRDGLFVSLTHAEAAAEMRLLGHERSALGDCSWCGEEHRYVSAHGAEYATEEPAHVFCPARVGGGE